MCGILARIGRIEDRRNFLGPLNTALFDDDLRRLHHRGPDAEAIAVYPLVWTDVALGMNRLSIVDLHDYDVPMTFDSIGVGLAYNGEIYNWRDLRHQLSGHFSEPWETSTDTEVIARAWRLWGADFLDRLNGMFAIVLVDLEKDQLFIARDRAGEKPLYWARCGERIHLASEVKSLGVPLVAQINPDAEVLEFDAMEQTSFEGVYSVLPGHYSWMTSGTDLKEPKFRRWWSLPSRINPEITLDVAVQKTTELLEDAVLIRSRTEVPATVFVSGGLDSAIVQAIAKLPVTYVSTFHEPGFDCEELAKLGTGGGLLRPVTFGPEEVERDFQQIAWHLDTPATWSALALWYMTRRVREDGFKVVLSGEGADELFFGYSRYRILHHLDEMRRDSVLQNYRPYVQYLVGSQSHVLQKMLDRSGLNGTHPRAVEIVSEFSTTSSVGSMRNIDWNTTMQVLLRMADRMTMAHSVENRSVFFDYRVIELATQIPTALHKPGWKFVLRHVAKRLGVAPEIIDDRNKRGLIVPVNRWWGIGDNERGAWDRSEFSRRMRKAWMTVFGLKVIE